MNSKELLYSDTLAWMQRYGTDAVEVTSVDTDIRSSGGCETCEYTEAIIEIWYTDSSGRGHTEEYSGGLGEFLSSISEVSA